LDKSFADSEAVREDDEEGEEEDEDGAEGLLSKKAFYAVDEIVVDFVVVAETNGSGGGVDLRTDDGAYNEVVPKHGDEAEDSIDIMGDVDLIVGLEEVKFVALGEGHGLPDDD
jgi:hypothetical protein